MDSLQKEIELAKQVEADIAEGIRVHDQTMGCLWLATAGAAIALVLWLVK